MKQRRQHIRFFIRTFITGLLFFGVFSVFPVDAQPNREATAITPYQIALEATIKARQAAGLPAPKVTFDNQANAGALFAAPTDQTGTVITTATTTVRFDGPEQAGFKEWPPLVVTDDRPAGSPGTLATGDYTLAYRKAIEARIPDFWSRYAFGHEPRLEAVTETYTVSSPAETTASGIESLATGSADSDILMGFLYSGPHINYTISGSLKDPIFGSELGSFKAGFEFDWGLGMRLPAHVDLSGPSPMIQGKSYAFTSSLTPRDWSGADYSSHGAAAENGNEFVLRFVFFAGVQGKLFGLDLCSICYREFNLQKSQSFMTPFGTGTTFPIAPLSIPIVDWGFGVGSFRANLNIQPYLWSNAITADWRALPGSNASGSGTVTFRQPGQAVSIGPVTAGTLDPSVLAQVQLRNFRYYFNQFMVNFVAQLHFDIFNIYSTDPSATVASFNLSPLTQGLSVGDYVECNANFVCSQKVQSNLIVAKSDVIAATNHAPELTLTSQSITVAEGYSTTNAFVAHDPDNDQLTLTTSLGTVANVSGENWLWRFAAQDGPAQSQSVTIHADDQRGGTDDAQFDVVVQNIPPGADFTNTSGIISVGKNALLSFSNPRDASSADLLAGFKYSYDCTGDGVFEVTDSAVPSFACPYSNSGIFTAIGRIKDKDGGYTDYPAMVTVAQTITVQVNAGADDVNEDGADYRPLNGSIWVGTGMTTKQSYTGLRFNRLNIPSGATIVEARLELYEPKYSWIRLDLFIAADASSNSAPFRWNNRPSQRQLTSNRLDHHSNTLWMPASWNTLGSLKAVIQEVVNRPGWWSGNSLSLIVKGIGSQWGRKFVTSYDSDPAHAPRLIIMYIPK